MTQGKEDNLDPILEEESPLDLILEEENPQQKIQFKINC